MIEILYNIDFDALSEGSGKIQAGRGHALFSLDRKVLGQFKYSFADHFELDVVKAADEEIACVEHPNHARCLTLLIASHTGTQRLEPR